MKNIIMIILGGILFLLLGFSLAASYASDFELQTEIGTEIGTGNIDEKDEYTQENNGSGYNGKKALGDDQIPSTFTGKSVGKDHGMGYSGKKGRCKLCTCPKFDWSTRNGQCLNYNTDGGTCNHWDWEHYDY